MTVVSSLMIKIGAANEGIFQPASTHHGTMMIWMKQMKMKTREAQAT